MTDATRVPGRTGALIRLASAQVSVLALWFSATAAVPSLADSGELSDLLLSLFTSAVQAGFVAGTLISAVLGLADRINPRRLFIACALIGAAANAAILLVAIDSPIVILLRFLTGMTLAGVYPVGMKLAAGWARGDMGLMVGLLVGALTIGSASPHLFNALGGIDLSVTLLAASLSAVVGAVAMLGFELGPAHRAAPPFHLGAMLEIWRNTGARLATAGYLGHMWELYAMWAWIGVFLTASFELWGHGAGVDAAFATWAGLATFGTIAIGGLGGIAGGWFADRFGRTTLTIGAMAISALCCVLAGFLFGMHPVWLALLCAVWGVTVVADSAQFSACIAELSDPDWVGTMLTAQTSLGFLLTLVTLHLMPITVDLVGWRYAFVLLAIGPALGCVAMWRLRVSPMATRLAGGLG